MILQVVSLEFQLFLSESLDSPWVSGLPKMVGRSSCTNRARQTAIFYSRVGTWRRGRWKFGANLKGTDRSRELDNCEIQTDIAKLAGKLAGNCFSWRSRTRSRTTNQPTFTERSSFAIPNKGHLPGNDLFLSSKTQNGSNGSTIYILKYECTNYVDCYFIWVKPALMKSFFVFWRNCVEVTFFHS